MVSKGSPLFQVSSTGISIMKVPEEVHLPSCLDIWLVDAVLCDSFTSVHLSDTVCNVDGDFFCRHSLSVSLSLRGPKAVLLLGQRARAEALGIRALGPTAQLLLRVRECPRRCRWRHSTGGQSIFQHTCKLDQEMRPMKTQEAGLL